ncbi:MAG: adenosine kinase [Cyclobacteriaceae bacterium]
MPKRKYDVFGMGNALVDIVFDASEDFLKTHDIEKGLTTLVDEERQNLLIKELHLDENKMQCGGSAANSIIAVNQFGGNCYYACRVADDDHGHFYLDDLKSTGVDTTYTHSNLPKGITGKCLVMVTNDASRTMQTFLGITTEFSKKEINTSALIDSDYLYIEGYLITSDAGKESMKFAKEMAEQNGVKTSLTFSDPAMVKYFGDGLKEVVGNGVDLLFCNEEEAQLFTGKNNLTEAREELKKYAKNFAITQGENGAIIFDGDTFIDIEPYPVKAIDTVGAGDMFAGAFLYGITHQHSMAEAGKIASLSSSKVVTQYGPRLELQQTKNILDGFLKS